MTEPRVPRDARELLSLAELTGVRVFEVHGKIVDDGPLSEQAVASPDLAIRVRPTSLETRMRLEVTTDVASLVADVSAEYTFSEPVQLSREVAEEFIERVAVLAVYPFVRESILTTAFRLGVPAPVLGLMHSGGFRVGDLNPDQPDRDHDAHAPSRTDYATPAELARELDVAPEAVRAWLRREGYRPTGSRWQLDAERQAAVRQHFRAGRL